MPDVPGHPPENLLSVAEQLELPSRRFKLLRAQNMTRARRKAGLTQLELARAAELSRATVHLIEAGICDPRLSTITRLADALRLDALQLLDQKAQGARRPGGD